MCTKASPAPTTGIITPTSATAGRRTSYWNDPKGIDKGEPSPKVYALNVLVGHHGVFSLTPVWLLSLAGLGLWLFRRGDPRLRWTAAAIGAISAAVVAFYLTRPAFQRNYGGSTSGFRWLFWLAPLWLLGDAPGGRPAGLAPLDPRPGPGAAGPLGPLGQLPDVEPLDESLADGFLAVYGLGTIMAAPVAETDPQGRLMR